MKTESYKLYSRDFWIFLLNFIKIDPYNFELYRFKVSAFFELQCTDSRPIFQCYDHQLTRCVTTSFLVSLITKNNDISQNDDRKVNYIRRCE